MSAEYLFGGSALSVLWPWALAGAILALVLVRELIPSALASGLKVLAFGIVWSRRTRTRATTLVREAQAKVQEAVREAEAGRTD